MQRQISHALAFRQSAFLSGSYPERIRELVAKIRGRVGIPARDMESVTIPSPTDSLAAGSQMMLF